MPRSWARVVKYKRGGGQGLEGEVSQATLGFASLNLAFDLLSGAGVVRERPHKQHQLCRWETRVLMFHSPFEKPLNDIVVFEGLFEKSLTSFVY